MAGIISNVDDDVQKLRKLKNSIEEVKKSLKGINIKVDIDIAKGLQSQLKSLTMQYNELVDKIAQAEAKILLSCKNINDASEKIIQAQKKVSKAANVPTQTGNANTQTTTAETASIQVQAKAYEDLKAEINGILGTREANVKRMMDEMNAIRLINAEIKKITKSQGEYATLSSARKQRLEQLNNSLLTHKTALAEVRQALNNNVKLDNAAATSMNGLSQSLSRMRIAYRELTEEERNSPIGKELLASINQADAKIKELDASLGIHARNVGDYAKQWNGLQYQVQMVARELPNFAINPQIGIMSLTNNIPYLVDELKKAKDAHKAYIAEVKAGNKDLKAVPSVGKQVLSSLLNWQTALIMGITLITAYRKEISDWVSGLFKAKSATDLAKESAEHLNKVRLQGIQNAQNEIVKLDLLYKTATDANKPLKERLQAVKSMKDNYPDYLSKMSDEKILAGNAASAYENLKNKILEVANARAAFDRIVENNKKIFELENDLRESIDPNKGFWGWMDKNIPFLSKNIILLGFRLKQTKNNFDSTNNEIDSLKEENTKLASGANLSDLNYDYGKSKKEFKLSNQSDTLRQQQEKLKSLQAKNAKDAARQLDDLYIEVEQSYIDSLDEGGKKALAQMELNHEKELLAIDREKEELIQARVNAAKAEFDAEENIKATKDPNYKKKTFDATGITLSDGENAMFDSKYNAALDRQAKERKEYYDTEKQAMDRYLKEYGTFQQKKDAITREYKDKVAKATMKGDKKILQKEMEETLSSLDMDKLKQEINWELVFGDLSKVSKKSLEQVKSQLKTFKDSPEYQNMGVDQKKVVDEALNNIQSTLIDKGGLLGDLPEQLEALRIAQDELTKAQDEYNDALKDGTDEEKEAALKNKNKAEKNVQNAETNVTKSADKTKQNLITLADTITQLGSSSEMSLSQIGSLASSLADTFAEAGSKIGGIIGAAFSLLDAIDKQGLDGFLENVFSSVFSAVTSIWDTFTFGAFSKITGFGDSDKTLEKDVEYLTQSNKDLKNALDNLSEKMDKASVAEASGIHETQKDNVKKQEANTLEAMQRSADASKSGIGGSHSSSYKINKGMSASEWKRVSDIVGKSVTNASDFFRLSSEQMAKLAEEDTVLYSKIKDLANDGYKDAAQYMDEYITYYKQLEELENAYNDKLTNTSFDSVRDSFKSILLDMESDAEDFADSFEKIMQNAIIESLMTKKYDKRIQDWYTDFSNAMKNDGKIDEDEQRYLKKKWDDIVNEGLAERDALKESMGWETSGSSSQSSTSGGFQTMSEDSADELNGRFTALQMSGEEIKSQNVIQTESLNLLTAKSDAILSVNTEVRNIADDTRDLIANSYLELVQISENTGNSAKYLKDIKADMAEVKRNTSKL